VFDPSRKAGASLHAIAYASLDCFLRHCSAVTSFDTGPLVLGVLQSNIVEHRNVKVVYRRYASLFFLVGIDGEEVR
jgi:hypothetical protein